MRKIKALLVVFVAGLGIVHAQQDPECSQKLSLFASDAKSKNYDAAYDNWKYVYDKCPTIHSAVFYYGKPILEHKIDGSTGDERKKYVDMLMGFYDNEVKYYPDKYTLASSLSNKAKLMYDENVAAKKELYTKEEIFNTLDKAYKEDGKDFKDPKSLYIYFNEIVDLQAEGKKELQDVFDIYDNVTGRIADENRKIGEQLIPLVKKDSAGTPLSANEKASLKRFNQYGDAYSKISESVDAKLGKLADCDNLIPLYSKNFEAKKTDKAWLQSAAHRLSEKDCIDDPIYVQVVEALHQIEPTPESAYGLGQLNDKKGNSEEALKYYKEAVSLQTDKIAKSKLLYNIAGKYYKRGAYSTAASYARQAIDNNASFGRAYLLIAACISNSANACGNDTFTKLAVNWKAAAMARKAAQIDPSVKSEASQAANNYDQRAPSKTDIFNSGMAGKTITFNCWVGGSVQVPNL
ncbi:hypothetical protein ACG2LH_09655 [Zhouia sp. PK063]|uniref:hypothetical protein n=1 Tax=Zhouia sp. PK063 TaxID=3373602 RepID=UPI00379F0FE5